MTDDLQQTATATVEEGVENHEALEATEVETQPELATPRLVLKRGGVETDIEFPLSPSSTIGRFDPTVGPIDVDLGSLQPEGSYVSRKHAKITEEEGVWKIRDLGSANGTFVLHDDFDRVEEADLQDGNEIAFGNARFVFRLA